MQHWQRLAPRLSLSRSQSSGMVRSGRTITTGVGQNGELGVLIPAVSPRPRRSTSPPPGRQADVPSLQHLISRAHPVPPQPAAAAPASGSDGLSDRGSAELPAWPAAPPAAAHTGFQQPGPSPPADPPPQPPALPSQDVMAESGTAGSARQHPADLPAGRGHALPAGPDLRGPDQHLGPHAVVLQLPLHQAAALSDAAAPSISLSSVPAAMPLSALLQQALDAPAAVRDAWTLPEAEPNQAAATPAELPASTAEPLQPEAQPDRSAAQGAEVPGAAVGPPADVPTDRHEAMADDGPAEAVQRQHQLESLPSASTGKQQASDAALGGPLSAVEVRSDVFFSCQRVCLSERLLPHASMLAEKADAIRSCSDFLTESATCAKLEHPCRQHTL